MQEPHKPWAVVPDVISDADQLIATYSSQLEDKTGQASAGETRIVDGKRIFDPGLERDLQRGFDEAAKVTGIEYTAIEGVTILRYPSGGEYSWHADNELVPGLGDTRKLSMVVALNTEFEGGGTEIMWPRPGFSEKISLPPGDALIFPSFLYHRGCVTTAGERWIIVAWAEGAPFR
ncbi:2OG-Fe(II) oxygenase [Amycolatopsis pithecellobii]|uniref:2OG-Fe(II) oxygenase n=1 Tax=Amycolatopsis pithecellobii TaxID=664692 RepID=UPI00140E6633|nr:2OG-Fe(II) oxygenase [Amycolatopsis pithecellobii]